MYEPQPDKPLPQPGRNTIPLQRQQADHKSRIIRNWDVPSPRVTAPLDLNPTRAQLSHDLREHRLAEEKHRQREESLRLLADMMPQIVLVLSPAGEFEFGNQRLFEYTGMTLEEASGLGWFTAVNIEDRPRTEELWIRASQTATPFEVECRIRRANGAMRWHLVRAIPMKDEQGQVLKWFGTCTDIHDQKTAEERLLDTNLAQRDFIAMVSHEFRTALTSIEGFSQLLCNENFSLNEVHEYAGDIYTDALRLHRLINNLLDLEKMQSGRMTLSLETVQLDHLLEELVERARLTSPHHILDLQIASLLPPLLADSDKLTQVITNLISNAIKYSPDGGEIFVACYQEEQHLHLVIKDQGLGIAPDALEEIFLPYRRLPLKESHYIQGTGLGLAIVRQIVQMHDGRVWAENNQEVGSSFHVVLPIIPPSQACTFLT